MTHNMSQWKIRLMSLVVVASVFTGTMATFAGPVSAKSKHARKSKKDNGDRGTQASTSTSKEMDQSTEQTNNNQQSAQQTNHQEMNNVTVVDNRCGNIANVPINILATPPAAQSQTTTCPTPPPGPTQVQAGNGNGNVAPGGQGNGSLQGASQDDTLSNNAVAASQGGG